MGSYHNYQATNCCFSEDGSLLAVSFEETVTVWDSLTWDLKCTFCHPPGNIRYVLHLLFYVSFELSEQEESIHSRPGPCIRSYKRRI